MNNSLGTEWLRQILAEYEEMRQKHNSAVDEGEKLQIRTDWNERVRGYLYIHSRGKWKE